MLQLIRSNKMIGNVVAIVAVLGYLFFVPEKTGATISHLDGPLAFIFKGNFGSIWNSVVQVLLLGGCATVLQYRYTSEKLFKVNSVIFYLVFFILGVLCIHSGELPVSIFGLIADVFILHNVWRMIRKDKAFTEIFNIAIFIGIISLIDLSHIVLLVFLPIFIAQKSGFTIRKWALYIVGFFLPWYAYLAIDFVGNDWENVSAFLDTIWTYPEINITSSWVAVIAGILLFLVPAIGNLQNKYARLIVAKRYYHQVNYTLLIAGILMLLLRGNLDFSGLFYVLIPISVILTDWFSSQTKRWVYEVAWLLFLSISVVSYYLN